MERYNNNHLHSKNVIILCLVNKLKILSSKLTANIKYSLINYCTKCFLLYFVVTLIAHMFNDRVPV